MVPLAALAALLIGVQEPAPAAPPDDSAPAVSPATVPPANEDAPSEDEQVDAFLAEEGALAKLESGEELELSDLTVVLGAPILDPSLAKDRASSFAESVRALEGYLQTLEQRSSAAAAGTSPGPTPQEPPVADPARPTEEEKKALEAHARQKAAHDAAVAEAELLKSKIGALAAEIEMTRRKLELAQFRANAWKAIADVYTSMTPAAQQAFSALPAARTPLWEQVDSLRILRSAVEEWDARLLTIQNTLSSGRLVGFMSQQQAMSNDLEEVRTAAKRHAARLADAVDDLGALAETQHRDGELLYRKVIRAIATGTDGSDFDALYLENLAALRRARRVAGRAYLRQNVVEKITSTIRKAPSTRKLVTIEDAEATLIGAREILHRMDTSLAALGNLPQQWILAFRREEVSALEPLASESTRREANQLTRELLEDLEVEALEAWRNLVTWFNNARAELSAASWSLLARKGLLAALILVIVGFLLTKRLNPTARITHWVAKRGRFRGRVGTVVRVGNFFHTIFPVAAAVFLLWIGTHLVLEDRGEAEVLDIIVKWYGLYVIGDRILLGLVKPTWGRSAFIVAQPSTVDLLDKTYSRLGFFLVLVLMVEEAAAQFLGVSRLRVVIDLFMIVWLAGWALWAALAWRHTLAEVWNRERPNKTAEWMAASRLGALLSPVALLIVLYVSLWKAGRNVLARGGILAYFRARTLRRKAKEEPAPSTAANELPEDYVGEFPLRPILGDSDTLVLPREKTNEQVLGQLQDWQKTRRSSSIVLVGEKGIGKTTAMVQLRERIEDIECLEHTWVNKSVTEADVVRELAPIFGADPRGSCDALIEAACARESVVFLDEAHNVFLRIIDGYQGFDALVKVVNATSEKVFWVLSFNAFSWQFINESKRHTHYFRRLLWLPRWERSEIQTLIEQRNRRSGFQVSFDPVLLGTQREGRPAFDLVESAEGFFRLLWETSRGLPRVALYFWLQSLKTHGDRRLLAQLFKEPDLSDVQGLTDEIVFVLAAICQHESLCVSDVDTVLRMGTTNARFALQFLREHGLVEPKRSDPESMGLAPRYYSQVLRFLKSRHLLFEGR